MSTFLKIILTNFRKFFGRKDVGFNSLTGFTLIEVLISAAIFGILITIVSGVFIRGLRSQRAIISLIAANDNASIALEQMIREIRTGYDFRRIGGIGGSEELQFINTNNEFVSYRLNAGGLERGVEDPMLGFVYRRIIADNIIVTRFNFILFGDVFGDNFPPRITLSISLSPNSVFLSNFSINLQSTVSARFIDT